MDLFLALLLMCLCRGVTIANGETDETIPLVPLIPLMPSHPIEEGTNGSTSQLPDTTDRPNGGSSEEEQDGHCMSSSRSPESREAIASGFRRLGMQLLQNTETTDPNVIISPLSIAFALSQLALGAVNDTEKLLMHHLNANTLPCYHQSLQAVLKRLRNNDLQIASAIFLERGFKPKPEFIHESKQLYDSEPMTLEGLQQVNEWVERATNGKMTEFLTSLPPDLLLMLINAVHFKGAWKNRFDPRFTSRGVFYIDDKQMVDVEMMEGAKHPLSLLTDNGLQAKVARFPFQKSMSLIVVMPHSGVLNVSEIAEKLNITDLYERLPKERAVQVKVPKFNLEYTQDLQEVLTKLGLGEIFSQPNLAAMADGPLLVTGVMHKSSMEINEEGAEASAATSVVISRASNPIFYLNQPFFLALVDDTTHVPIFMGVITNPNPEAPILQRADPGGDKLDKMGDKLDKAGYPADIDESYFGRPPK